MRMIEKSMGDGTFILVEDPNQPIDGKKHRRKLTNITPKKKRRKKR